MLKKGSIVRLKARGKERTAVYIGKGELIGYETHEFVYWDSPTVIGCVKAFKIDINREHVNYSGFVHTCVDPEDLEKVFEDSGLPFNKNMVPDNNEKFERYKNILEISGLKPRKDVTKF